MNQIAKKKSGGRTATREARRIQLINATIDSISKHGFSGTTLSSVTRGAKMSHGVVNFHFKSKEALYEQTLGFLAQEHYDFWSKAMMKAGGNLNDQLAAIISTDFHPSICTRKKVAVWFALWGQAKYRPSYLKLHDKFDKLREAEIERLCAEITKEGNYKDVDPYAKARNLVALLDGFWLNFLLYPKTATRKQGRQDIYDFLASTFPKHFSQIEKEKARDTRSPIRCSF